MVKIVKNPGNWRLNNLNDPVLNVLICVDQRRCEENGAPLLTYPLPLTVCHIIYNQGPENKAL